MTIQFVRGLSVLLCLAVLGSFGKIASANAPEITAVQVAPDVSSVIIKSDGPLGKHSSFVIDKPFRLVIDFEDTSVGKLQGKIRVDRGAISEIRLGYHNNRARVVFDFGENPVPAYQIEKKGDLCVVALGRSQAVLDPRRPKPPPITRPVSKKPETPLVERPSRREESVPPDRVPVKQDSHRGTTPSVREESTQPDRPKYGSGISEAARPLTGSGSSEAGSRTSAEKQPLSLTVSTAEMKNNLLIVELLDRKDPKITFRIVLDLDMEELMVRGALLTDARGNLKKFELTRTDPQSRGGNSKDSRMSFGPRKNSLTSGNSVPAVPSKWETSSSGSSENLNGPLGTQAGRWPVRIEEFNPQTRRSAQR